jgi:hypothetical protein
MHARSRAALAATLALALAFVPTGGQARITIQPA